MPSANDADFTAFAAARCRRRAVAGVIAVVMVTAGTLVAVRDLAPTSARPSADRHAHHRGQTGHRTAPVVFPGGGEIVVSDASGLQWVAPDGAIGTIGHGFAGGEATATGAALLAWQATAVPGAADQDYYITGLHRSRARLVLAAEPSVGRIRISHLEVQVSPNGSVLAYIRERDLPNRAISSQLLTLNLATGASSDLGPVPSGTSFAWQDSSSIVAQSPDLRSLLSINVRTGARSELMGVSNPRLVRAFERARPGAGPPTRIMPIGASPDAGRPVLAVDLTATAKNGAATPDLVAFVIGDTVKAYAVGGVSAYQSLTWGPDGYFAILTTDSPPGCPPANGAAYVGNVSAGHLARVPITGKNLIVGGAPTGAAFSPSGHYLAVDYQGFLTFTLTPTIGSLRTSTGYPAHLMATMPGFGETLQGWARQGWARPNTFAFPGT